MLEYKHIYYALLANISRCNPGFVDSEHFKNMLAYAELPQLLHPSLLHLIQWFGFLW